MTSFNQGHALLIGVGGDLPNTVDDARGLADMLRDPGRCAYPPAQVQTVTAAEATRGHILAALETLAKTTDDASMVVVFFSGHGYRVTTTTGPAYYLLPHGYDVARLYETAVSGQELADALLAIPHQKLLLLLDCCHAGGLDGAKAPAGVELAKAPMPAEVQARLGGGHGRVVIASSRADELSYAGTPYSAFTLALLEALAGAGASRQDGYVRVSDLAMHAATWVPRRTQDRQHPLLDFKEADNFILAYYAGGETAPKGLPFTGEPVIESAPGALARQAGPSYSATMEGDGVIVQGRDNQVATGGSVIVGGRDR